MEICVEWEGYGLESKASLLSYDVTTTKYEENRQVNDTANGRIYIFRRNNFSPALACLNLQTQ